MKSMYTKIMVSAMGIVMMLVMSSMFSDKRLNVIWMSGLAVLFAASFFLGRAETFVGDAGSCAR